MSIESKLNDLVLQTEQLDNTIQAEITDIDVNFTSVRSRLSALEGALGVPEDWNTGIPGGGGSYTVPGTSNIGNDVVKIDPTGKLLWLWNPTSQTWVSIPFASIAPPVLINVQAIIDQANTAIDAGLNARLNALAASITSTALSTQQTQIDGLASTVTTLGTTVSGHTSAIQTESTARANGDSALANQLTDLVATVGANNSAFLSFQAAVAADPTSASAQLLNTMQTNISNNTAAIQTESSTRSTQNTSLANQISTLTSAVGAAQAAIVSEANARSSADTAISTVTTSLASQLGTAQGAITALQTVTSGLNSNTVSNITTLSSQVGSLNTTVQDVSTAVNGISGKRTLAINANGQVTGIQLLGGGTTGSQIKFQASNFIFYDPSTNIETVPFAISGGAAYINKAIIKDADIDTLKIAGNAITQVVSFQGAGDTSVGANNTTALTGTITLSGNQPVLVNCTAFLGGGINSNQLNGTGVTAVGYITIGGYTQNFLPALTVIGGILGNGAGSCLFPSIPAGTYTVSMVFRCLQDSSNSLGFFVRDPRFSILETKR